MAGIKEGAVYRAQVRAKDPAGAVAGWGVKGSAQAGSASVRSVGSGRLIRGVSRVTSSCARSAILP
jgi:hypothetical protein